MKARIAVNNIVAFQGEECNALSSSCVFSRFITSSDPPVIRKFRVGQEWTKLDFAWAYPCGLLLLKNESGRPLICANPLSSPTSSVEVHFDQPSLTSKTHAYIPPQEILQVCPAIDVYVRSSDNVFLSLLAVPY